MTQVLHLQTTSHPDNRARHSFESLIGIDKIKEELIKSLIFMFDVRKVEHWIKQQDMRADDFIKDLIGTQKLVILSGDVGCGKTMLANSIGTPLAERLDAKVLSLESPTNVRGQGMVGELSARITSLFDQAKSKVSDRQYGVLIIDEADDLATSRSQMQAHHEDRAGVNVLARQIDLLSKDRANIAVVLITNRLAALDPAILRRSAVSLKFERPDRSARIEIFRYLRKKINLKLSDVEIGKLAEITERNSVKFTYSDILRKGIRSALADSIEREQPLNFLALETAFSNLKPTPLL